MAPLSPQRKRLRILGITLATLGIIAIIYGIFIMTALPYRIQNGPEELGVATGQTPFQKLVVAAVGFGSIYLGYRVFRYIPVAERERENVSELDLEKEGGEEQDS